MRLTFFLCMFSWAAQAAPSAHTFTVNDFLFEAGKGGAYLVLTVREYDEHQNIRKTFPLLAHLQFPGVVDPSFGKGGFVSFRDLEGWDNVTVGAVKRGPDGALYVGGRMGANYISRGPTAWETAKLQEMAALMDMIDDASARARKEDLSVTRNPQEEARKLHDQLADLLDVYRQQNPPAPAKKAFRADKLKVAKAFVSKVSADGKFDSGFGYQGTQVLDGVLDTGRDRIWALTVGPRGEVTFAGSVHLSPHKADTVVGVLNPDGTPKSSFGKAGLVRVPVRQMPEGAPPGAWRPLDIQSGTEGITVLNGASMPWNEDRARFFQVVLSPDGRQKPKVKKIVSIDWGRSQGVDDSRLSPDGKSLWVVHMDRDQGRMVVRKHALDGSTPATRLSIATTFDHITAKTFDVDGSLVIAGSRPSGMLGTTMVTSTGREYRELRIPPALARIHKDGPVRHRRYCDKDLAALAKAFLIGK